MAADQIAGIGGILAGIAAIISAIGIILTRREDDIDKLINQRLKQKLLAELDEEDDDEPHHHRHDIVMEPVRLLWLLCRVYWRRAVPS